MAVHLQPFCGKLNRLREQPTGAQPRIREFVIERKNMRACEDATHFQSLIGDVRAD